MESTWRVDGFVAAWAAAALVGGALTGWLEASYFQFGATLILQGFLIGVAQGVVLRRTRIRGLLWVPATGVGWLAGALLLTVPSVDRVLSDMADALGTLLGLWEVFWLQLVNYGFMVAVMSLVQLPLTPAPLRGWRWPLLSLAAGMGAGMAGAALCNWACAPLSQVASWMGTAASMGAAWVAYALVTGPVLAPRLRPDSA